MAISIQIEPNAEKIMYARSPIIYRMIGGSNDNTYRFQALISRTASNPTSIYATVDRQLDLNLGITVDISRLIYNYIRNYDFNYETDNYVYFAGKFVEYDEDGNEIATVTSSAGIATLGYIGGEDGYNLYGNTVQINSSKTGDYLMMNNLENKRYTIPNFGANSFWLTWHRNNASYAKITYYDKSLGTTNYYSNYFSFDINRFECGYYDLMNTYGAINIDTNKEITVEIIDGGSTVLATYKLYPLECNYNDIYGVKFMNKWGVWEIIYLNGKSETQTDYEYDVYKYNMLDRSTMTYDFRDGSYHKYNTTLRDTLKLNTGWIEEVKNEKIKDLLASEFILINNMPYIVNNKSIKYKTDRYDKLVDYTLDFEKAYDQRNNIK